MQACYSGWSIGYDIATFWAALFSMRQVYPSAFGCMCLLFSIGNWIVPCLPPCCLCLLVDMCRSPSLVICVSVLPDCWLHIFAVGLGLLLHTILLVWFGNCFPVVGITSSLVSWPVLYHGLKFFLRLLTHAYTHFLHATWAYIYDLGHTHPHPELPKILYNL